MTHGDDQRIGGELGYGSDKLPLVAEDDVTVEAPDATEIAYDDGTNTIVTADDVAEALDDIEAEFVSPTHSHGGAGATAIVQAANLTIVAGAAQDTDWVQAVAANEVYAIQVIALFSAIDSGDSCTLIPSGPAGSTWHFVATKVDESGTFTSGHAKDGAAIAILGSGTGAAMFAIHGIFTNGATPGNFKFTLDAGGAGTLKKGSVMYIEHTA